MEIYKYSYYYADSFLDPTAQIYLECGFEEDDYLQEYCKFIQEYNDIFREAVTLQQLLCIKKMIIELYNRLFKK